MAPSRRKGASKAAAAPAARMQWKVGDLVLAKVKGFPAWPATVSEPGKWGYSTDWKKVVVYFFGTRQIAFCNPADVEAFTEEKKQSLLNRQGKGADFVRAVQEIIDSFEKLKKESQVENNSSGEVTGADVSNTVDSSADLGLKDEREALDLTLNSQMKSSSPVMDSHEPICAVEDASAAALRDESSNKEASLEEPNDNSVTVLKSPFPVTYTSRKRSADLHPHGYITQRVVPVRRSRSSSRVQNIVMPCIDDGKSAGNILGTAVQNVSVRRNKHIRKSPNFSGCDDVDSSGLASNGSLEGNGSEIFTVDSETFSPNEGSTIDSNSKIEHSETIECLAGEVELNNGLDLEIMSVVNKKKRKPNRKRATNDADMLTIAPDEEAGVPNTSQSSQILYEHLKERCSEQDRDEHLPLLKRARVRMGKLSSTEIELNSILQVQDKRKQQTVISSKGENGSPADGDSSVMNGDLNNVSYSKSLAPCYESGFQSCEIKKDQTLACSVDGKAVLPPSKRLHRALEAMSANVAEERHGQIEASSAIMTSSGSCCISSITRYPSMPINSQGGNCFDLLRGDSCGNDSSHSIVHSLSTNLTSIISEENKSCIEVDKQLIKFQNHEICEDVIPGASNQVGGDLSDTVVCQTAGTDPRIQFHAVTPPNIGAKCCEVGSSQDSPGSSLLPNDEDSIRTVDHSNKASDTAEHTGMSLDIVSGASESGKISPQNSIDVPLNEVAVFEDTECVKPIGDSCKVNDM